MSARRLPIITALAIPGRSGVTLMARIVGNTGDLITQASISSIAYGVTDLDDDNTSITTGTQTVASVIFDSLQQTDNAWTVDDADNLGEDGRWSYNYKWTLAGTVVTVALSGHRFQIDVRFTPVTGEPFTIPFIFKSTKTFA